MAAFEKFLNKKRFSFISKDLLEDIQGPTYNVKGSVYGVTYTYGIHKAQKVIRELVQGDLLHLAIRKNKTDDLAVIDSKYRQIGWYRGCHYDLLLEKVKKEEPISIKVELIGKIPEKDILWCAVRVVIPRNIQKQIRKRQIKSPEEKLLEAELAEISKEFHQNPRDYGETVRSILQKNARDIEPIQEFDSGSWFTISIMSWAPCFILKYTGRFKYWLVHLASTPKEIDGIKMTKAAKNEQVLNMYSIRIFIRRPEDLYLFEDIILEMFDAAYRKTEYLR